MIRSLRLASTTLASTALATAALTAGAGLGALTLAGTAGAAPGPGGAGSITVDLDRPVDVTGHADVAVACGARNHVYTASSTKTTVDGHQVTIRATVGAYRGPGTYAGIVNLTVVGPGGNLSGAVRNATVTVTGAGGSVDFDHTFGGVQHPKLAGKELAGTVTWACS